MILNLRTYRRGIRDWSHPSSPKMEIQTSGGIYFAQTECLDHSFRTAGDNLRFPQDDTIAAAGVQYQMEDIIRQENTDDGADIRVVDVEAGVREASTHLSVVDLLLTLHVFC